MSSNIIKVIVMCLCPEWSVKCPYTIYYIYLQQENKNFLRVLPVCADSKLALM